MDDKKKHLLCNAQALLTPSRFKKFVLNFEELLGNSTVHNWNVKLLKFFKLYADYDMLTKGLFEFLESSNLILPDEFYFASKAYKLLDNYKLFLYWMSEYVDARCTPDRKKNCGGIIMQIVRRGDNIISINESPQKDGTSVNSQDLHEFQFWVEMFLNLELSVYKNLVSMVKDYKRALSNEGRDDCIRKIVMVIFGLDMRLTKKFLNFFAPGSVDYLETFLKSVKKGFETAKCSTLLNSIAKHYQIPNSSMSNNPSQLLTPTFEQNCQTLNSQIVENPPQISTPTFQQNCQTLNSQTVENLSEVSTATFEQTGQILDSRTVENSSLLSTTTFDQNCQILISPTDENPSQVSTATFEQTGQIINSQVVENTSQVPMATVGQILSSTNPSANSLPSEILGIISEAHQVLDNLNFEQFSNLLLEYKSASKENKQILASRMMEIVRIEEHKISENGYPQRDRVSAKLQAFHRFRFRFEMFLRLGSLKYTPFISMVDDYLIAPTDEDKMECARKIVMVVFALDRHLTKKFLGFFFPGKVNSVDNFLNSCRQRYQRRESRPAENPSRFSTPMTKQNYTFQNTRRVENSSQVSTDRQRYPSFDHSNQEHSTMVPGTALIEPNNHILNTQHHVFQPNVLEGPIRQIFSVSDLSLLASPQTMSFFSIGTATPAEQIIPDQEAQTAYYLPLVPVSIINFVPENHSPIESSSNQGFGNTNYLLSITTGTPISNTSIDLFYLITASPAEPQCLDQETRAADNPLTVTAAESPDRNSSPGLSSIPSLSSSVADYLLENTDLFNAEFMDHSSLDVAEQFRMLESPAPPVSTSSPFASIGIDQNMECDSGLLEK